MSVPAVHPSMFAMLGIITLVLWRVYSRVRRMVGRQTLRPRRLQITLVVFPLLLAMLMLTSLAHPLNALYVCAGATTGALLGLYGLRLTRFEVTGNGLFYTPNAHLGVALSLVFIGRIIYRLVSLQMVGDSASPPSMTFTGSPLTLLIFAMLAGYYVSYAIGLLRWSRSAITPSVDGDGQAGNAQEPAGAGDASTAHGLIANDGQTSAETRTSRD